MGLVTCQLPLLGSPHHHPWIVGTSYTERLAVPQTRLVLSTIRAWPYYSLCLEFSIYPHSFIYQNNSRLSSGIFSRRRAFFTQFPKWDQLNADFVSIYLISQLNNLTCPLAHVVLISSAHLEIFSLVWNTFPHASFYPQHCPSRRILWGEFLLLISRLIMFLWALFLQSLIATMKSTVQW